MRRLADPAVLQRYVALSRKPVEAFMPAEVGAALLRFIADLPERPGRRS